MRFLFPFLLAGCTGAGLRIYEKDSASPEGSPQESGLTPGDSGDSGTCLDDRCYGACVDLASDPSNCGVCGATCIVIAGEGACEAGTCVIGACDPGQGDCDGDLLNGCERTLDCVEGGACSTTCGSQGRLSCVDPCNPTCQIPTETCNALDDTCEGACDEGPLSGCRHGIYRSSGSLGHLYGSDLAEVAALGQTLESADFFFLYASETSGLSPFYRCDLGGGRRFLTVHPTCEIGLAPELVLGYIATSPICGSQPLYRLYSSASSDHFYTTSAPERDNAVAAYGYIDEGIAGYIWAGP